MQREAFDERRQRRPPRIAGKEHRLRGGRRRIERFEEAVDLAPALVVVVEEAVQSAEIGPLAKKAALVSPASLSGSLSVSGSAGVEVRVAGVAQATTPLLSPLRLPAGPHEVQLRAGGQSARTTVQIASGGTTTLDVCATAEAVTTSPCAEPAPFPVLLVAGGMSLGLGVVGLAVAGFTQAAALSAEDRFAADGGTDNGLRDEILTLRTVALTAGLVGGALAVAGAAMIVVDVVVE